MKKFGKSGGGKSMGKTTKLLSTPTNMQALGSKGAKKSM